MEISVADQRDVRLEMRINRLNKRVGGQGIPNIGWMHTIQTEEPSEEPRCNGDAEEYGGVFFHIIKHYINVYNRRLNVQGRSFDYVIEDLYSLLDEFYLA